MGILAAFTEEWLLNDLNNELGLPLSDIRIATTQYIVDELGESNFSFRANIPSFQESARFAMNNIVSTNQSPEEKWLALRLAFSDMTFEMFCNYYRETCFAGTRFGLNSFDRLVTNYYDSCGYDEALNEVISRRLRMIESNSDINTMNAVRAFDMATAALMSGEPFRGCNTFREMVEEARASVLSSQQVSFFHEKAVFEPLKKHLRHQAILK